ncbi:cytochrome c oxidase biogenesis protein Cmc1 like protein [Nitzschia inconspicua]|uniref:COX assembly mitochondrial protein n=1 Tax=Nitzschia inconspicua TaxID=303405 RepID=A0A9K3KXH8_9STRA|nr:cytochrome c oxidase biogenesis protein Cmc1 like protein [Nitzschia inconspicua]
MSQQQQAPANSTSASVKDDGRDGRLSFRNFAETQLRKEFKAEAMKKCDLQVGTFAECIQEQGLWAPFRCKEFQKDVNECMAVYNSEERFELFKKEHQDEIDSKPYVQAGR